MKRISALLLVAFLTFGMFAISALAADSFELPITGYDEVAIDEGDTDGQIYVYPAGDAERVVESEEFNLRYVFIFVCDKDGKILEAGNNLVKSSEPNAANFQNEVTAPAGGHVVTFYYNSSNTANQDAYDLYNEVLTKFAPTTDVYNETVKLNDCPYTATYKDSAITFSKNSASDNETTPSETPDESSDISSDASADVSSDASPDVSSDASAEVSSDERVEVSSEVSADASSAESIEASSTIESSEASDAISDAGDDDSTPVALIVIIAVAVVAAIAVAVVVFKKKK